MPMTLEEYDHQIGHHLRMIRHHAAAIETHMAYMTRRPDFETLAEEELHKIGFVLVEALDRVKHAIDSYKRKPIDA
jgi:hypothetical protein